MAKGSRARKREKRIAEKRGALKKLLPGYLPINFALLSGDIAILSAGRAPVSQPEEEIKKDG